MIKIWKIVFYPKLRIMSVSVPKFLPSSFLLLALPSDKVCIFVFSAFLKHRWWKTSSLWVIHDFKVFYNKYLQIVLYIGNDWHIFADIELVEPVSERIRAWSDHPHGSGLGTSSILARTIIITLWGALGKVPVFRSCSPISAIVLITNESRNHTVDQSKHNVSLTFFLLCLP